jgi:hypothetical protein
MSGIEKLNIEQKLPIIRTLIENDDTEIKPNIITLYTISKSFNISYMESIILLNQFILNEDDLSKYAIFFICETVDDSGIIFSKKIISSCDKNVSKILDDSKHTLSYGVFGICLLKEYYLLENYNPFIGENVLITRFDFSDIPENQFTGLNKAEENNLNKSKKNDKNNNKPLTKNEKNKKEDKKMDKDEENYFGNFQPKKAKTDKDKINLNIEHDIKKKRKPSNDSKSEKEKRHLAKKNKYKEDISEDSVSMNKINLGEIKEENKNEDVIMKDATEENKEPRKIRKTRKIKVTKQYMNEKGYMVTKDVEVEEEYWSDEKPEKKPIKQSHFIQESKPNKHKKKTNKGQTYINSFFGK